MAFSFLYIRYEIEFANEKTVDLNINVPFENNVAIRCANFKSSLSRFRANTTFYNFSTTFAPNQTAQEDILWNPKS